MAEDGRFDANLYNQLSGLSIRLPSLAEHPEDIPDIAMTMLTQLVDANEVPAAHAHGGLAQRHAQPRLARQPAGAPERREDARAHLVGN
jgi:DNA-binding NtrC family response regulator